ncbi:hypothetical protein GCM10007390_15540 [Persicitalea jodogahamensis]|uniref:Uncharacterized protein n=1 Tax=Persicitalea jodogahamensis TaxID=402147 RepID=A0A8J3D198_9BACT|nr:hypothetical protein GCM10007390_15540 [Persicitalea jodogahamensis]
MILIMQIPDKIFHKVPDVEKQKTHFELLLQVNALMVQKLFFRFFILYENERI